VLLEAVPVADRLPVPMLVNDAPLPEKVPAVTVPVNVGEAESTTEPVPVVP
jgi:hypothetical protein